MPLLRPLQAARFLSRRPTTFVAHRALSASTSRRASGSHGHEHEDRYDPPGDWLWGVPPGYKQEKEGWENMMYWGMWGGTGLFIVALALKPDTSIQTWALEEAQRRLEKEGILPDPDDAEEDE